jgi:hypothetical protein
MEYVIPAVVVVLLVAGFVTFLVLNATRKGSPAARGEETAPGIGADDQTPLGDTTEHAGEQTEAGTTARDPEQGRSTRDDPAEAAHTGRPGEGEGRERLEFDDERPRSERLANRDG